MIKKKTNLWYTEENFMHLYAKGWSNLMFSLQLFMKIYHFMCRHTFLNYYIITGRRSTRRSLYLTTSSTPFLCGVIVFLLFFANSVSQYAEISNSRENERRECIVDVVSARKIHPFLWPPSGNVDGCRKPDKNTTHTYNTLICSSFTSTDVYFETWL